MGWAGTSNGVLAAAGVLLILALLFFLALSGLGRWPELASKPAEATVIAIYPEARGRSAPLTLVVQGRAPDGRIGEVSVRADEIRCKVGDKIHATEQGISLYLKQSDCVSAEM